MSIQMPVRQSNIGLIDSGRAYFGGSKVYKELLERTEQEYARDKPKLDALDRNPPPRWSIFDSVLHAKVAFIATGLIVAAFALVAFTCPPMFAPVYVVGGVAALCLVHNFTTNGSFQEGELRQNVKRLEKDMVDLAKSYRDALDRERPQARPTRPAPPPQDDLDDSTV